jgi:uncharacterized protein YndB with AHSA1/START domain
VAPIVSAIEVARPPDEVFAYLTDPARLCEWQRGVVSGQMVGGRAPAAGSRFTTTTRIGGAQQTTTLEITEFDPPARWSVRGVDGPVRVIATATVEPAAGTAGSRVTLTLEFEGHGPGKLLVPLVVRPQAAHEAPRSCRRLKERLERPG